MTKQKDKQQMKMKLGYAIRDAVEELSSINEISMLGAIKRRNKIIKTLTDKIVAIYENG